MSRRLDLEYDGSDRLLATFDVFTTAAVITAFSAVALGDTLDQGFTILDVSYEVQNDQDLVGFENTAGARYYRRQIGRDPTTAPARFTFKMLVDPRFTLKAALKNFYDWISTIARIENAQCELSVPLDDRIVAHELNSATSHSIA